MKKQSILSFVKLLTVLSTLMPLSAMAQFDIESADALVQEAERIKEQYPGDRNIRKVCELGLLATLQNNTHIFRIYTNLKAVFNT